MRILAIETSTYSGSIAVLGDEGILGEYYFNVGPSHTEKLVPSIDWLMGELGIDRTDLTGVVVSLGPGSFTALRVGISTAKGICFSLGIPLVGVSSLKTLAMNLPFAPYNICPVIDARKGEGLAEIIKGKTIFIGDGALLYKDFLEDNLRDDIMFSPLNMNFPRASCTALSEIGKFKEGRDNKSEWDELMNLAPHYLRKSEAEISKEGRSNERNRDN